MIMPRNTRDNVAKEVQVLTSEKIIGYNTYSNILDQTQKLQSSMDDSDYYNVTVNFIVKRNSKYSEEKAHAQAVKAAKPKPTVSKAVIKATELQVETPKQVVAMTESDEREPSVIIPTIQS